MLVALCRAGAAAAAVRAVPCGSLLAPSAVCRRGLPGAAGRLSNPSVKCLHSSGSPARSLTHPLSPATRHIHLDDLNRDTSVRGGEKETYRRFEVVRSWRSFAVGDDHSFVDFALFELSLVSSLSERFFFF